MNTLESGNIYLGTCREIIYQCENIVDINRVRSTSLVYDEIHVSNLDIVNNWLRNAMRQTD